MNLLLLRASDMSDASVADKLPGVMPAIGALDGRWAAALSGRRAAHLREVLDARPGSRLRVAVLEGEPHPLAGKAGVAEVVAVESGLVIVSLHEGDFVAPAPPSDLRLVLAVPRPKVLRRILRFAASFGVGAVDLINSWRVERGFLDSPLLEPAAVEEQLWLGAEQGGWPRMPAVRLHRRFTEWLRGLAPAAAGEARLLAHPTASQWVSAALARPRAMGEPPRAASVTLAVGPEGGWIERELVSLADHGFVPFRLSRSVLRVEDAVPAALAQVELALAALG